jgi:rubrerythrin
MKTEDIEFKEIKEFILKYKCPNCGYETDSIECPKCKNEIKEIKNV